MKIKIDLLTNKYLTENKTFDKESAINLCGKIAGICYDKEGFSHLENEPVEKTNRRIDMTLNNGHHSVYDHIVINFNLQNVPKILAMFINNENQYTTSEKSARYTPVVRQEGITATEEKLYNKWIEIFKTKITDRYGEIYGGAKIQKLAQENARYLVTVFMPTQMIYSTSLRQINYLASWMKRFIKENNNSDPFFKKVAKSMGEFLSELDRLNVLESGLLKNEKERTFSLFAKDLEKREQHFGYVYSTTYKGSFAQLAQAHRHRTLDYQIELLSEKEFFVPPIIENDKSLVQEWLKDMKSVEKVCPQGELVNISEVGNFDDFILKCKERLCSSAQLEIMAQTKITLEKYRQALKDSKSPLANIIEKYCRGARCTFPDFCCSADCKFNEGKLLTRKI